MSYSFGLQVREGDNTYGAVLAEGQKVLGTLGSNRVAEMDEHVETAARAVAAVVDSGAFGRGALVSVKISGHAEPGHKKRDGGSQDSRSISLSQVQEPKA